ncbi:MAG: hypothetical protein L3K09_02695, partial [Thermoplasmata archaeon]|nr:hypothetical protein [Thermoplasmata archaeon]
GALASLFILVAATELAQWLLLRTVYFGTGRSSPFYALAFRSGVAGILILALASQVLAGGILTVTSIALLAAQITAILAVEVSGSLLSLPAAAGSGRTGGGPLPGALVGALGFFLLAFGSFLGGGVGVLSALVATLGGVVVYRRLRQPILSRTRPPAAPPGESERPATPFGRTDR